MINLGANQGITTEDLRKDLKELYEPKLAPKFHLDPGYLATIVDITPDAHFIMVLATLVEGIIFETTQKVLVKASPHDEKLYRKIIDRPKAGHWERLEFLELIGQLGEREAQGLKALAIIRNKFAHQPKLLCQDLATFYHNATNDLKNLFQNAVADILHSKEPKGFPRTDTFMAVHFREVLLQTTMVAIYTFLEGI